MTIADVVSLARTKANEHGFGHVPIRIDNSKRRLGGCAYQGTVVVYFTFSSVLMPLVPESDVLDTILHEIAHAKTPGSHHGREWQMAAMAIGAKPEPCSGVAIDAKLAGYKYIAACACGENNHGKCRRPTRRLICSTCRTPLNYVQQY